MDTHAERCGKLLEQLEEKTLDDPELLKLPVAGTVQYNEWERRTWRNKIKCAAKHN